jgi:hypothetical protein
MQETWVLASIGFVVGAALAAMAPPLCRCCYNNCRRNAGTAAAVHSDYIELREAGSHFAEPALPEAAAAASDRFVADGRFIRLGTAQDATRGLKRHLGIDDGTEASYLQQQMAAIENEFVHSPSAEDRENFRKVRDGLFIGDNAIALDELLAHPNAQQSDLKRHHLLAMRLYTTSSHACINLPMRGDPPTRPHPFAATTYFLAEGICLLRSVALRRSFMADEDDVDVLQQHILWRGVADHGLDQRFFKEGGTEFACMSTSIDKEKAYRFAGTECPLLLKFIVRNPMQLGADVSFLSVYPTEREVLYPPLTYLQPNHLVPPVREQYAGTTVLVAEVAPFINR